MMKNRLRMLASTGVLSMTETPVAGGTTPVPGPPAFTPVVTPVAGMTFTQEDLNRIATAEHEKGQRQGKQAAAEQVATTLGVTLEQAAAIIKAHADAENQAKTQAQRDADAAAKTKAEADVDRAAAKAELHAARVERALTTAGVDIKAIAAITVPGITVDSTAEEIKTAVDAFKVVVPALFTGTVVLPTADPQRPGQPLQRPATGTLGAEGTERFRQMYPEKAKA